MDLQLLYEKRIAICNVCPMRYNNFCNPGKKIKHVVTGKLVRGCGCNLSAKVLSKNSKCPAGKW